MNTPELSIHFETQEQWRKWLLMNFDSVKEIWVIYFKKHTGKPSIIYHQALEEALCFGWIDGIVKTIDEERYMQRFTPRRDNSKWSQTNIRLAHKLMAEGKMHESGLRFQQHWVEKENETQHEKHTFNILPEFAIVLMNSLKAHDVYIGLPPSSQKQYNLWISQAKRAETRVKRIAEAISLLEKGEKLGLK